MNILILCFALPLVQLLIQYWMRNHIKDPQYSNLQSFLFNAKKENVKCSEEKEMLIKEKAVSNSIESDTLKKEFTILSKTLKHLKFISEFETYLETKSYKNFPIELVKELERVKLETQMSVLKTTSGLNDDFDEAA